MSSNYDIVILQDATGSQQPFINAARDQINSIVSTLRSRVPRQDEIRFRLIPFRDHEPQEHTFVTYDKYKFTTDPNDIKKQLSNLLARGGGDGPEAQLDALTAAKNSDWGLNARRVVIICTDSPPHGIGEKGDAFRSGYPPGFRGGTSPTQIVDDMADEGINVHVIACEPTMSENYRRATEYWLNMAIMTGGLFIPMSKHLSRDNAKRMLNAFVGAILFTVDSNMLLIKHAARIQSQASRGANVIARDLYHELSRAGVKHYRVHTPSIYARSKQADYNLAVWKNAKSVGEALHKLQSVPGHRILPKYRSGNNIQISYKKDDIKESDVHYIVRQALAKNFRTVRRYAVPVSFRLASEPGATGVSEQEELEAGEEEDPDGSENEAVEESDREWPDSDESSCECEGVIGGGHESHAHSNKAVDAVGSAVGFFDIARLVVTSEPDRGKSNTDSNPPAKEVGGNPASKDDGKKQSQVSAQALKLMGGRKT